MAGVGGVGGEARRLEGAAEFGELVFGKGGRGLAGCGRRGWGGGWGGCLLGGGRGCAGQGGKTRERGLGLGGDALAEAGPEVAARFIVRGGARSKPDKEDGHNKARPQKGEVFFLHRMCVFGYLKKRIMPPASLKSSRMAPPVSWAPTV